MWKPIVTLIAILPMLVLFQNCSPMRTSSTTLESEVDFEKWAAGEKAWNTSCLTCHGNIDETSKRDSTVVSINEALQFQSEMTSIQVTQGNIEDIAYALTHARPKRPPGTDGGPGKAFSCVDESLRGASTKNTSRLSYDDIQNVLADTFGPTLMAQVSIELGYLPKDSNQTAEGFIPVLSDSYYDGMMELGDKLSGFAAINSEFIQKFSSCSALDTPACVREFLVNFSTRILKQPLPSAQIDSYMASYSSDADVNADTLIFAILLRPEFSLFVEEGSEDGDRIRLNSFEVASRISFQTTGHLPDDELWAAAKSDELKTLAQVEAQVTRLMASPLARKKVVSFFRRWMQVEPTAQASVSDANRDGIDVETLYEGALADFDKFVEYLVWEKKGTFADLFFDESVFPGNSEIANNYGTGQWTDGPALKSTKGHKGILLRAATLIGGADLSPIIQRGVHVRRGLLCDFLPTPDQAVIEMREENQDPAEMDHSLNPNRVVVHNMTKGASCVSCHAQINPLGTAFEGYDSLGRLRTVENFFDMDTLITQHEIDTSTTEAAIEAGAADSLAGADDLNAELSSSDKVRSCFAKQMTVNIIKRDPEPSDDCTLSDKEDLARDSSATLQSLFIRNIATEDIFWRGRSQ